MSPPKRLLEIKDEEMPAPQPVPPSPTFLPDAPDIPDAITELNEEENICVYVYSEQKRVSFAQPARDLAGHDVFNMSTAGAVASHEGLSQDVPQIVVPPPRRALNQRCAQKHEQIGVQNVLLTVWHTKPS